jgi:outer membrane protein assembly factor BamD (BamD/ComL family)
LSAERAILDNARTALARGDSARAVALTDEHARQFGRPSLAEEREAIAVQALVIQGRYIDARARASRFRAAYPNSLFLPAVDSSVASIP